MQKDDPVVIVGSARTPLGSFLGMFANMPAVQLGATAIKAAISRSHLDPNDINEVIMGCVLSAGIGQAPARQASIYGGLPNTIPCSTINKVCGSGMKSVMLAHDLLLAGNNKIMLAGGMESMSNAPYLLDRARNGYRAQHARLIDEMMLDGLEDAYEKGCSMGLLAENTASKYKLSREIQDEFAIISLQRAQHATQAGLFINDYEITPTTVLQAKGDSITVATDEQPNKVKTEKIPTLKPVFKSDGTITAANSSSISDGAAALVLMRLSEAKRRGLKPIAQILGHSSYSHDPAWYTTAPITAIKNLLQNLGLNTTTPDLYEINEAFAVVPLAAMHDLQLNHDKVNILGGACALGHPIGASGTRIICTLLTALQHKKKSLGVASLCIGGGEACAIAIEMI